MKITIVGTGYVGLVTGACLSEAGAQVCCVDSDHGKIGQLQKGEIPIYEPGLTEMVQRNHAKGRLEFVTALAKGIEDSEVVFVAVGTPPDENGSADLRHVLGVAREIGQSMNHYTVVVTKSTVPVGTSEKVRAAVRNELEKRGLSLDFDVASNPEFLKEGNAIEDFMKPDRIVVGVDSDRVRKIMEQLYKPFVLNNHPIYFMDILSAEMTKYASNAMLATKISFINDVANLCELVGADIDAVRQGITSDSRIGKKFLYPGAGYGGSCFPKDVKALIRTGEEHGYSLRLLKAVEDVNQSQKQVLYAKMLAHFRGDLQDKTIALWGLSFKPGTDDMREAPSIALIERLLESGARVRAYDPAAGKEAFRLFGTAIEVVQDPYEAVIGANALVVLTEWNEFRLPNFKVLSKLMTDRILFDGRNIYSPEEVAGHDYHYVGIGRKAAV
ncbi:MAG: UDP-glucose/GDP-mannose dehydrogenase family protein [Bacteroidales bacterium]